MKILVPPQIRTGRCSFRRGWWAQWRERLSASRHWSQPCLWLQPEELSLIAGLPALFAAIHQAAGLPGCCSSGREVPGKTRASEAGRDVSLDLLMVIFFLLIFGRVGSLLLHAGFSLVAASGGYSSLWCVASSLRWLLLLQSTGFSSCSMWAQ